MSLATDVQSAVNEVGRSAQEAGARVTATVGGLRTKIADLEAQIQALIDAGSADAAALEAALVTAGEADAMVDSIDPAPVVEPPVEPPTGPPTEPPVEPNP